MQTLAQHTVIVFLLFTSVCVNNIFPNNIKVNDTQLALRDWQYQISNNNHVPKNWKPLNKQMVITKNNSEKYIWLKTKLPKWDGENPAIYIGQINHPVRAYHNGKLIYQFGNFDKSKQHDFIGRSQNLISLPKVSPGDVITFEILQRSNFKASDWKPLLTSKDKVFKDFFAHNIDDLIFAAIFLSAGIIILMIFILSFQLKLLLGISVYLISMAFFLLSNDLFLQMLFPAPALYYHVDYISFISATVGAFYAIEQIISRYKIILKSIWIIHLIFLAASVILILFTNITYLDLIDYFLMLLTINLTICLFVMILNARKGEYTAKVLIAGMSIFILFALAEIFLFYKNSSVVGYNYSVRVLHIGAFIFVISLIWIAVTHYLDTYRQRDIAQKKEIAAVKRESKVREQFAAKLIDSQENERNRIAGELHDSIGQDIIIAKSMLSINEKYGPENVENVEKILSKTVRKISEISHDLRPLELDELGLTTSIESMIDRIKEICDIEFNIRLNNIDDLIDEENRINLFRIVQEALNNVVKHSDAETVNIYSIIKEDLLILTINDNGKGFDMSGNYFDNRPHFGLAAMKERASLMNGEINIVSRKNEGTTITLSIRMNLNKAK